MITDPIADMLTRIRNANQALHEKVEMPVSGMRKEIARILLEEGYIEGYTISKGETFDTLAAVQEVKRKGGRVLGVVNVVGSTIGR